MSYALMMNINPAHRYLKYENVVFEDYGSQESVHKASIGQLSTVMTVLVKLLSVLKVGKEI